MIVAHARRAAYSSLRSSSVAGSRALSYVAAIDQGTSSSRVILYDTSTLKPVASHQVELQSATSNPKPGWSQMDPMAILSTISTSAQGALDKAGAKASDVVGVGITNQRESTVVWDKVTGKPLYDAILWHDARTSDTAASLINQLGGQDALRATCGLPISTYFTGVKLRWLLDNVPEVKEAFAKGTALVGTVDSWVAWNLTGGAAGVAKGTTRHVTDLTNASRTMMMDLASRQWDAASIEALGVGVAKDALPQITSCAEVIGTISDGGPLDGAPLSGLIGDQQSAMVGQRCFGVGQAKITYGTGCFMLVNSGAGSPKPSKHGLLSTALYQFGPNAEPYYALEGAVASCAVGINWFKDSLRMIDTAPEISKLAGEVDSTDGLVFVSAFSGLLAPHWRDDARGTLVGLTFAHDRRHMARAVLEGIAFQAKDVIGAMEADTGTSLAGLRVDGGVSLSNELLQMQSDLCNTPVERPKDVETTAMGAAISAGIGAGVWSSVEDLASAPDEIDRKFTPQIDAADREARSARWQKAVEASFGWATA
jgi:glycerol kinase